ncbi:MAG: 5-oxoprolinase subunit PxpB [Firmicutes bacterium]|nr:5-oxoprolinase subunit PxpB [Bacillota bacterium]
MPTDLQFFPAGDRAILAQLGKEIDEAVNDRVRTLYRAVLAAADPAIIEAVPAYTTVLVHYRPEVRSFAEMKAFLTDLASKTAADNTAETGRRTLVVPVCYGLHFGPDLWEIEEKLGLSRQEIIDIHSSRDYRIYMMGFLPGFVYLGGMDERLAYPRLKKPRLRIEAGAVGIAGGQTGIYPSVSPGGWRIIGNTPILLFDPSKEPAVPVSAGDAIRFRPIPVDEWYEIKHRVQKGQYEPEVIL